jgi:sphinganine-1-phosphate aldolase
MLRIDKGAKEASHCYTDVRTTGCVYIGDQKHWDFVNKVMSGYIITNPLHADEFKTVTMMEAEVIRMIANMYNGDSKSCGCLTSGGTESILLACLAYREKAKERGVTKPNMVMSNSAHAAFDKAAFYW